jgi:quercetin dioxygenase-like cupin family protein
VRTILTEWDADGRSAVARIEPIAAAAGEEVTATTVWTTDASPPPRPAVAMVAADPPLDVGCPPNGTIWRTVRMGPGYHFGRHRTETLDYDTLVAGSLRLELDTALIDLVPGDCVVLPGVPHGWQAGDDGAVLNVVMTALAPEQGRTP